MARMQPTVLAIDLKGKAGRIKTQGKGKGKGKGKAKACFWQQEKT